MRQMKRWRTFGILAALFVGLWLVLGLGVVAYAEELEPVKYLDENGEEQYCRDYADGAVSTYGTGWYVVKGNRFVHSLSVEGDAKVILCDDSALVINHMASSDPAVSGSIGSLTVYGQSTGMHAGRMTVTGSGKSISLNMLTINGGDVVVNTLAEMNDGITSPLTSETIIVNGGSLISNSPNHAGIWTSAFTLNGGLVDVAGSSSGLRAADSITINGGYLKATNLGNYNGLAGSGITCVEDIVVNGGTVSTVGYWGARAAHITINNGVVSARGTERGLVTVSSPSGSPTFIAVNGGTVTVSGDKKCFGSNFSLASDMVVRAGSYNGDAKLVNPIGWAKGHSDTWAHLEKAVLITDLVLSKTKAVVEPGGTMKLDAIVKPDNASYRDAEFLTWGSDNESVATVDENGVITGVAAGTAVITVKSAVYDEVIASCMVTVKDIVHVTAVELDKTKLALGLGESQKLNVTLEPENADDKSVTWKSDNENVATVDEGGIVTSVGEGEAVITATSVDNSDAKATCTVSVTSKPEPDPEPDPDPDPDPDSSHGQNPTSVTMLRLYNPYNGEHFYTASTYERDSLVGVGWKDEGVGWIAPRHSDSPVFRLYNPFAGDHHYTLSSAERDHLVSVGWNDEGVGWYSAGSNGVPIYRQYNPYAAVGTHNYTPSKGEAEALIALGWKDEGIGWYGL
ncbi:Ig-like domain-containing protein [Olsenella intestinalis]|uniref:Ig-like domain-containing protein n=1 Tax=Olsenella intestinalis TaxID=2930083 RepID=UPI00200BF021|nr:Ig-like domain-containing protein [Olsenella intestinalis]